MPASRALLAVGAAAAAASTFLAAAQPMNVMYIPLDERFTTRDAFLNMAGVAGGAFNVSTPDTSIISLQRQSANLPALDAWIAAAVPVSDASIISLELYLYGGLIASRCSNDTTDAIMSRLDSLVAYAQSYPANSMLLGTVVMRIPAYNTDPPTEDPWYWQYYGLDLFTYSFYLSKFNHTHNQSDYATAMAAAAAVPTAILDEFVWRRHRNFNVTAALLSRYAASVAAGKPLFHSLYITLDDNAEYGFNIDESTAFKALVQQLGLQDYVKIYPGADEVGLSMLARLTADTVSAADALAEGRGAATPAAALALRVPSPPTLDLVFRKPDNASLNLIPNYEGQPMIQTLLDHVSASGAVASYSGPLLEWVQQQEASGSSSSGRGSGRAGVRPWRCGGYQCPFDARAWPILPATPTAASDSSASTSGTAVPRPTAVLLTDNFGTDEYPQIEAPNQPMTGRSVADYAMFTPYVCGSAAAQSSVLSFGSNRYSNGADIFFVQYMLSLAGNAACTAPAPTSNSKGMGLDRAGFSGWNTDGNSIGTAIANLVVLRYFADFGPYASGRQITVQRVQDLVAARRRATGHAGTGRDAGTGYAAVSALRGMSGSSGSTGAAGTAALVSSLSSSAGAGCVGGCANACVGGCANSYFNILRLVEDCYWQAGLRTALENYVAQVDGEDTTTLAKDLDFYERYSLKVLSSRSRDLSSAFGLNWNVSQLYYPWNRTFEIGLIATPMQA